MKTYWLPFGDSSINPVTYTGLAPTFIAFYSAGTTALSPGITESPASSGAYSFQYGPTLGVYFVVDWGLTVPANFRYSKGALDPIQAVDERVGGILANNDSIGSTASDPSTVIGYLKRALEFWEGNAQYIKSTGTWNIYSRGSTTLLRVKNLTNNTSESDKT
jgi:hypothetical protein